MHKKKIFHKRQYDIAVDEGAGAHLITWVTGLMIFFATLALSVHFGLSTMMQSWVTGLSGSLTVEISPVTTPGASEKTQEQQAASLGQKAEQVLKLARQNPAVSEARLLGQDEIRELIRPWLGEKFSDDIPLPALVDIKLVPQADIAKLQSAIITLIPEATIDTHTDTLDDVQTLVNTIRTFVLLLTGVIVTLAIIAISGIVRSKFSIHKKEVETLHLIGASDEYIASQFRQHTLGGTLKGALIGVSATLLTLLVIGYVTRTVDTAIFPQLRLLPLQWSLLIVMPLLSGLFIAHLTAQAAVMKELEKLP